MRSFIKWFLGSSAVMAAGFFFVNELNKTSYPEYVRPLWAILLAGFLFGGIMTFFRLLTKRR